MKDLISVIVPIYGVEAYLDQCIQSIRNQTYKNLEIILVDDGSNDQCPLICDYHAQKDTRIKVIHKENGGIDSARKAGMLIANGKYVGYVDGDDWIEPEMYERLLSFAHYYHVDIVESGVIDSYINVEKERTPYLEEGCYKGRDFVDKVESKLLYAGVFFEHGVNPYLATKLFLKEAIIKHQMDEGLTNSFYDDIMVSLPCIADAKSIYITYECYYHYRVRRGSSKRECRQDEVPNLLKCYPEFYAKFAGTSLCSKNDRQIKYFTMYWLLYKAPYIFDDSNENDFLVPFGRLNKMNKIILYGAGAAGICLENYIRSVEGNNMVCWVDQNYKELQDALDVIDPQKIVYYEYDYIIISIMRGSAVQSAKKSLIALGVPEGKILWIEQKYLNNPEILLRKVSYKGKRLLDDSWGK